MKKWADYIDEHGMIQQKGGDVGDAAQRIGMLHAGLAISRKLDLYRRVEVAPPWLALELLYDKQTKRYTRAHRGHFQRGDVLTRDQATGVYCLLAVRRFATHGLAIRERVQAIKELAQIIFRWKIGNRWRYPFASFSLTHWRSIVPGHKEFKEGGKAAFPSHIGSSQVAILLRAAMGWLSWPLLILLDIELVINGILWLNPKKNGSILNHIVRVGLCRFYYPTPFSYLAWKLLKKVDVTKKLHKYFDKYEGKKSGPPMYTIWDKELLSK